MAENKTDVWYSDAWKRAAQEAVNEYNAGDRRELWRWVGYLLDRAPLDLLREKATGDAKKSVFFE